VSFPDNLGTGFLLIEFADFEATYDLLDGTDLPNATEDINFAAAIVKMGSVYSNGRPASGISCSRWIRRRSRRPHRRGVR